ncbi:MAG: hypothetical protein QM811_17735 [Pirellulales bacterium]
MTTPAEHDRTAALRAARAAFGEAPRRFGWLRRYALRLPRPRWLRDDAERPEIAAILRTQDHIWSAGEIVWGAVVHATDALAKPGIDDFPAVVLYSFDPQCEANVLGLAQAAKQLAQMIEQVNLADPAQHRVPAASPAFTPPAAGVDPFAKYGLPILQDDVGVGNGAGVSPRARLQENLAAPTRYDVPLALTAMIPMIAGTVLVRRLHLPNGRLSNGYFPLVVDKASGAAAILPSRYWPSEIVRDWTANGNS